MSDTILIIGATGTVGSELVKNLKQQGQQVRIATSKKTSKPDEVHLNLMTGEGLSEAFNGVQKVFLLSPGGYSNQDKLLIPALEQAKKQNLKKVVLMTAIGVNASDEIPLRKAEIFLEKSGLRYNIIRPNWFYQNFNSFWLKDILEKGKILLPAASGKVSFIDSRDISAVAAKLLVSSDFDNQAFDLTGPESIDHSEVAKGISDATGKNITYENVPPETLKKYLVSAGLTPEYSDMMLGIFGYIREGYVAGVNDSVQKILGRAPTGLKKYAQDYKNRWV